MTDEPDLDWGDDYEQQGAPSAEGRVIERTPPLYPTYGPGDGLSWGEFFRDYRAGRREKTVNADAELLDSWLISDEDLTGSPKKVFTAVKALGWDFVLSGSRVRTPEQFYVGDSATTGARAGDLRAKKKYEFHFWMSACRSEAKVGFSAHWIDGRFSDATIYDPIGIPVQNWFEYRPPSQRREKDETEDSFQRRMERANLDAERRRYEYNDGTDRLERRMSYDQMAPFAAWVDDYLELWAPETKRLTVARKTKEERAMEKQDALLAGGDWS